MEWNFALIRRNGAAKGQRANTTIAEAAYGPVIGTRWLGQGELRVKSAPAEGMMCYLLDSKTLQRRTASARFVSMQDIVKTWDHKPSCNEIAEAKASLQPTMSKAL